MEAKSTWKSNTCSIFRPVPPTGIDCESGSLSGDQPAVYPANESQSEAVCGVARPSSAEAFLCVGEYKRVVPGDEERISSDGQRLWPVSCKGECLRREHFLQDREDSREGTGRDSSEPPDKTFAIDRAQLVHCDKPRAIAETTAYTPGVSLPPCGHWGHDDCP